MDSTFSLIRNIARIFCGHQAEELQPPTSTLEIGIARLRNLLRAKFPDAQIFVSDWTTKLCDPHDIKYFLKQDKTNHRKYIAEKYDCDDFAYRLLGQFAVPGWAELAFGLVWTDLHALNCFVDSAGKFWYIEPQKDTIQLKLSSWQGTEIRLILM